MGQETFGRAVRSWSKASLRDGEWTGLLFETMAEDKLIQPTILYDFPTDISPLSKQKPDDPSLTERFEIYVAGMEIANGFSELNDPAEQERRFLAQIAQGGDEVPKQLDVDYVRALCHGLPPTAGEGIGIDRLTMLLTDSHSIRDVILFPQLRPEAREPPEPEIRRARRVAACFADAIRMVCRAAVFAFAEPSGGAAPGHGVQRSGRDGRALRRWSSRWR